MRTRYFRLAYDALKQWREERADVEYVRILHLAATTMEANVDSALPDCRKWRWRRATQSAEFSVTFFGEATGFGKSG